MKFIGRFQIYSARYALFLHHHRRRHQSEKLDVRGFSIALSCPSFAGGPSPSSHAHAPHTQIPAPPHQACLSPLYADRTSSGRRLRCDPNSTTNRRGHIHIRRQGMGFIFHSIFFLRAAADEQTATAADPS